MVITYLAGKATLSNWLWITLAISMPLAPRQASLRSHQRSTTPAIFHKDPRRQLMAVSNNFLKSIYGLLTWYMKGSKLFHQEIHLREAQSPHLFLSLRLSLSQQLWSPFLCLRPLPIQFLSHQLAERLQSTLNVAGQAGLEVELVLQERLANTPTTGTRNACRPLRLNSPCCRVLTMQN